MRLLEELNAIVKHKRTLALTPLGKQLAKLPVDPRYARMVVSAKNSPALSVVSVIVAGLSIQDPRERPLDKQQQADEIHREFADDDSDFITLYNIYEAFISAKASLNNSQLRKWCKKHFLHYLRMREWQDIIFQIQQVAKQLKFLHTGGQEPDYRDIHCALASGLCRHA